MSDKKKNILFIHQNMPGQFKHLAPYLGKQPEYNVVFLTKRPNITLPNVASAVYKEPKAASPVTHQYLRRAENAVRYGQQVARSLLALKNRGYEPDLIIGHPGWGETLYCKDVYPSVPLINLCEFFYRSGGADLNFDPDDMNDLDANCRARTRTAHLLLCLDNCDAGISPTQWQKSVHPIAYQDKIDVIFDGIDTKTVKPNKNASLTLPDGSVIDRSNKVVTYVARNLEPYRGFKTFMRSIPHIQQKQPDTKIIIIGGDDVSYGRPPASDEHSTWREVMDAEVDYDKSSVYFLGKVPYSQYLSALQISTAHVYLTYPFVLSWSCLEAMSCECTIVASATAPVQEVIRHGYNGILLDFFDHENLAASVCEVLANPDNYVDLGVNARSTIVDEYEIRDCIKKWSDFIRRF